MFDILGDATSEEYKVTYIPSNGINVTYFKPGWWVNENDVLFSEWHKQTREKKFECSYQESNLRPSYY